MELQTIGVLVFVILNTIFVTLTKYFGFRLTFNVKSSNMAITFPLVFGAARVVFCLITLFLSMNIFEITGKSLQVMVGFVFLLTVISITIECIQVHKKLSQTKIV